MPRQHGRHVADGTFNHISWNENAIISIKISLKFVPKGPINKIPAMVQIMAWRRPGDKPLSEAMMVSLLTHIWVTRPQWVKNTLQSITLSLQLHSFVSCRKAHGQAPPYATKFCHGRSKTWINFGSRFQWGKALLSTTTELCLFGSLIHQSSW